MLRHEVGCLEHPLTAVSSTVEQKSAKRDTQPNEKTLAYHKEALDLIPALGWEANMKQKYHLSPDSENHKIGNKVFVLAM